jgi:putative DNA primase/helicase
VQDWSGDAQVHWWKSDIPLTEEDKNKFLERRRQIADEIARKNSKAADKAREMLNAAKLDHHGYLDYKGLGEEKGFVLNAQQPDGRILEKLLIPMRNVVTDDLVGLQQIYWLSSERKYEKKMIFGMQAKDAILSLGGDSGETWLVEGYVTGLSLRKALRSIGSNARVVVCFSASNMVGIAPKIGGKRFIFADHDESKVGESSAISTGLPWTMADEVGFDANDLHDRRGIFAVVKKIMQLRTKSS